MNNIIKLTSLYFVGVVIKSTTVLFLFRGAQMVMMLSYIWFIARLWSPAGFGSEKNATTPTFQPMTSTFIILFIVYGRLFFIIRLRGFIFAAKPSVRSRIQLPWIQTSFYYLLADPGTSDRARNETPY